MLNHVGGFLKKLGIFWIPIWIDCTAMSLESEYRFEGACWHLPMAALRSSFELGVNSVVTNYSGRAVEIRVRVGS